MNQGFVRSRDGMVLELFGQTPVGLRSFGHDQQPRRVLVESVDEPDFADSSGYPQVVEESIEQGVVPMARTGMTHNAGRFVDDEAGRVLIENVENLGLTVAQ